MKIVLTAINAKYIHPNPAIYSLRASAKRLGVHAELAEFTINQPKDLILRTLYRMHPDMLCISCYIWNIHFVEELITELSKVLPDTHIWLGGPEVSYHAAEMLEKHPCITGIMKGEGEATFAELASFYQEGIPEEMDGLFTVRGIAWRNRDGQIHDNPWREVMDLSEAAFIYEDLSAFENRIIYYETSRGCPFSCSYCLSSADKKLRFRDLSLVKKELQFFLDHNVPQVKFVDRTFNCKKDHAMAIWQYLADHDNGITNFHCEIAADLLTEDELELLSKLRPGLLQMEIGVQSTNPQTIRAIKRVMNFQKVAETVKRISAGHNIHQHLDLIAGLPFEDYASFRNSFADVYALQPQQLQLGFLKVLRGSYMYEHTREYGCIYQEQAPYEFLYTDWMSYEDVLRLKGVEEMVEIYYNSGQFTFLLSAVCSLYENPFDFYEELSVYYQRRHLEEAAHSRIARYEILLDFLIGEKNQDAAYYRELAVLDLYARENMKTRPAFAADPGQWKESIRRFYKEEEQGYAHLPSYKGYDWKQLMRMTHIEVFHYNLLADSTPGCFAVLFDYRTRDPLTGNAKMMSVALDNDDAMGYCKNRV